MRVKKSTFCRLNHSIVFPIAKKQGVRYCISHSHNTKFSDYRLRAIRNKLMCLPITKVADYWFACSEVAGEVLYGRKFRTSSKARIINNAISCNNFCFNEALRDKKRQELNLGHKMAVGYVGRLNPQKNVDFVISVFKKLLEQSENKDYILLIVGTGPLEEQLKIQAEKLKITGNVVFMGQRKDVHEIMQAMDILVLPSLYEGLPVVLVEAQIAGLPCVVSDRITKEVALSEHVQFVAIGDTNINEWVAKIETLAEGTRKGGLDLAQIKGYDIRIEAKKLEDFYLSL